MITDDIRYLDHAQLADRGWTRALVARFLKRPDSWGTVSHWANFKGKALYDTERVIAAETSVEFAAIFARSVRLRSIGEAGIAAIKRSRAEHDTRYRAWLATLTPDDIERMVLVQDVAAIFEEARARGYRTPHK